MRRAVILGTGTGVGKTHVTERILAAAAAAGCRVLGLKPIETGVPPSGAGAPPYESDAARLEQASFHVKRQPHPLYSFVDAISPHLAARSAGVHLSTGAVARWVAAVEADCDATTVVIESAGAVFSPLSEFESNLDLARALDPALWILVAPNRLGVLHDVTATLIAMRARARQPDLVVLSAPHTADASTASNPAELLRLGVHPLVFDLGWDAPLPPGLLDQLRHYGVIESAL